VGINLRKYNIVAYNIGREIDVKRFSREYMKRRIRLAWEEPLYFSYQGKEVFIYSFGSFVVIDPYKGFFQEIYSILKEYTRDLLKPYTERYEVIILEDEGELKELLDETVENLREMKDRKIIVTDSACILKEPPLTREIIKIIAFTLAQSLALERIEKDVDAALEKAQKILSQFEKSSFYFRVKPAVKSLISVLRARFDALSDVMVLEKPEIVWEEPELDILYEELRAVFEIDDRFRALDKKLEDILEMGRVISDLASTSRELILESLILLFIILEILLTIMEFFFR